MAASGAGAGAVPAAATASASGWRRGRRSSQTAASPAEAATKLVAALAKGDITGASLYAAAADRERFVSLMQASDTLAKRATVFSNGQDQATRRAR